MNDLQFLFPLALLIAPVVAYIAYKKHWKIADIFWSKKGVKVKNYTPVKNGTNLSFLPLISETKNKWNLIGSEALASP